MPKVECWFKQDLKKPVKVQTLNGNVFTLDNVGSLIGVEVYDNGSPATLSGSVNGYIILPDDTTVSVAGTRSGNKVSINLPQSALAIPGFIKIAVKLTNSSEITTLLAVVATVYKSRTDTIITPSQQIITDWSQQIAAEMQAVEDVSAAQDAKISDLKSAINGFDSALNIMKETPYSTTNSWRLSADGLAVQNVKYKFIKYAVTAGDKIFIRTKTDNLNHGASYQFQTDSSVGSQSNPYIVGSPYLDGYEGYVIVPETAQYLIISALLTDDAECGVFKVGELDGLKEDLSDLESEILDKVEYEITAPFVIANNWGLKPSGLSVKRTSYKLIKYKVIAGTKIYLKTFVTIADAATYQFQSDSSVSSTENPYIIGSPVLTAAHGIIIVPEGATWLIISALKTDAESGVYAVPGMRDLEDRVGNLEERISDSQIVADNKDATNKILASRWLRSTTAIPLTLLWFSDIHRDKTALERIIEYKNYLNGLGVLDDTIATGDLVYGSSQDASSETHHWENFWENTPGTEDILITIGNHEYYEQGTGTHGKISMSDINNYFLSGIENWDVVRESNNSFYYKDYEDQNIRLIVCDPAIENEADETTWLADTLEGAKTLGYSVVVASHTLRLNYTTAITSATVINNSWTDSETKKSETIPLTYDWTSSCDIADCVSDFIEGGGSFLCYLIGHQHWDRLMYPTGHPDQLIISVAAATDERVQTKLTSNDLPRYDGTRTQDCFNVITFDAENKIIKCVRVGANMTMYEEPRTAFAYDVASHRFISVI